MKLDEITEKDIKNLTSYTILARGIDYYKNKLISDLEEIDRKMIAKVHGNNVYNVEIWIENNEIQAECDCPYDDRICKHIIAALYQWINKKSVKNLNKMPIELNLKESLNRLSKDELMDIISSFSNKYNDLKNFVTLKTNSPEKIFSSGYLNKILYQIKKELRGNYLDYYATLETVKKLKNIKNTILIASLEIKLKILETFVEEGLKAISNSDDSGGALGDFVINCLKDLGKIINESNLKFEDKKIFLVKYLKEIENDEYGLEDGYVEFLLKACKTKEDYDFLIEKVKEIISKKKDDDFEFYTDFLIELYKNGGREKEFLENIDRNLKDSGNYLRLAEFWREKGEIDKAISISEEAIRKRKIEFYDGKLFELLEDLYEKKVMDKKLLKLYIIHFKHFPSLNFYNKIIKLANRLNRAIQTKDNLMSLARIDILINIYLQEKEYKKAIEYVLDPKYLNDDYMLPEKIKEKVANAIKEIYPKEALKIYFGLADKYLTYRVRDAYKVASLYYKEIKNIYLNILRYNDGWNYIIEKLREENKRKPALIKEFSKL